MTPFFLKPNLADKVVSPSSDDFICKHYLIRTTSDTNLIKFEDRHVFDISSPFLTGAVQIMSNAVKCCKFGIKLNVW